MIAFDFDGVLADSSAAVRRAIDDLARRKNVPAPTDAQIHTLGSRALLRHFRVAWWELPLRVWQAKRVVRAHQDLLRPQAQLHPVLDWAHRGGVPLAIVSSNGTQLIRRFVARHFPGAVFAAVLGDQPLFAKHRALHRLKAQDGLIYVGDEVRDIEAARRARAAAVAVSWGKDGPAALRAAGPDALVDSGEALLLACRALVAAGSTAAASRCDGV